MSGFTAVEQQWIARLGNLRNTVRQELVARQLAEHVSACARVLDVGCGQGTQAVRMAMRDAVVTGVDPSAELLSRLTASAKSAGVSIKVMQGSLGDLPVLLGARVFDVVCAHGLLMYLDDAAAALAALAQHVDEGGLVSVTFRNGDALAFRPGLRRDWRAALDAFGSDIYVNELGVQARAHRLNDVTGVIEDLGFDIEAWYGVRMFTDSAAADELPPSHDLEALLEAEWIAGLRDPYRRLASQIHVVARRS